MEQIIATVRGFDGAHVLRPEPGGDFPEVAWGDVFFFYAPDGRTPGNVQPYGTIVTKDQPGDTASELDSPGRWRVNVRVGRAVFRELTGEEPRGLVLPRDHAAPDVVVPHPVYGPLGWISVVNPGGRTADTVVRLLRDAHEAARARSARRGV
ncbi:DUF6194 family protein [Streptomyces filamentosus]|uniref:DUF6194 domain-containing protein n=1 Tax=Streptomyces filamentosus TaxID=67294 RepID=A0A919BVL3_STRFL|nr:DUF6194 family protein [Streptomyces filamentosus]GHG24611.1 hypothetical protein GCM10017667_70530 [Streptomyces filamentosus]